MLGLGEQRGELLEALADLREYEVDFLTLGQYLQPGEKYLPSCDMSRQKSLTNWESWHWRWDSKSRQRSVCSQQLSRRDMAEAMI